MVYQTTSTGSIIAKVYRDLGLNDPNFEADAVEWIGEALGHIGVGPQMSQKTAFLIVENHTVMLPLDFMRLIDVAYYGASVTTIEQAAKGMAFPLAHTTRTNNPQRTVGIDPTPNTGGFHFSSGNIITTFETGALSLSYYGMDLDDNGYPLVPDHPSFAEAFLWYIITRLMLKGWQHPNREIGYGFAESRWLKYCAQARSKAKMPSIPALDQFLNNWKRTVDLRDRRSQSFMDGTPTTGSYGTYSPS